MWRWIGIAVVLLVSGCATQNGGFSERDKVALENRIDELESLQLRQKVKIATLEKDVSQLENLVSMISRRTSAEPREVVKIEPENGRVSPHFDHQDRNVVAVDAAMQDDAYQEIIISEEKKRAYFGGQVYASAAGPSRSANRTSRAYDNVTDEKLPSFNTNGGAQTTPVVSNTIPSTPMTFYQEGIDLYRQGKYDDARSKFETFLATKPDESYMDNALYWIGECFYGQELYHEAAGYFHRIVQDYPKANKVPDALLKVSLTYQKLGKTDSAREMLRYLMEAFPGTEAARIGKEKYESLISTP